MAELGVGIVGAGWVAGEHIKSYEKNPHCRVTAICSRTRASAERKVAEHGLSNAKVHDTFESLLADSSVDIISICSPPDCHPAQTITAAGAGKHMLIEKAAANDPVSLGRMLRAVEEAGVRTVVSFVLHWNPQFIWMKHMMDTGAIGRVFYAEADYWHNIGPHYPQYAWNISKQAAGSSFLSAGVHAIDAVRWFVGDEAEEVSAYATQINQEYQYPPTVVGVVKFKGGAAGKLSSCLELAGPYMLNIDLLGEKGCIRDNRIWSPGAMPGATDWITVPTIRPDSGDVTHHPFDGEIAHFVDCVLNGSESDLNLADAAHTHALAYALDKSVEEKRPVKLEEIWGLIRGI